MRTGWLLGMGVLLGACSALLPSPTLNPSTRIECGIPDEDCAAAVELAVDLVGHDVMDDATFIAVGPGRDSDDANLLICFGDVQYVIVDVLRGPGTEPIATIREQPFEDLC